MDMVVLLFTDLVGSTELLERLGDDAAENLRHVHFGLLRQVVAEAGGEEVKNLGDGLMVAFPSAVKAVGCAVAMQRAVAGHNEAGGTPALLVRVGLHAGEPFQEEGDFFGTAVVAAERLCGQARGGQILASEVVAGLVGSRGGFRFRPAGTCRSRGWRSPSRRSPSSGNRQATRPPDRRQPPLEGRAHRKARGWWAGTARWPS